MMRRWSVIVALMLLMLAVLTVCSDKSSDSKKVAATLENRLADALQFDDSKVEQGQPPSANTAAPKLAKVEAPQKFIVGKPFQILLEGQESEIGKVKKAVVYVKGANRHLVVERPMKKVGDKVFMELKGWVSQDVKSEDKTLEVEFAFQDQDGFTGEYLQNDVQIYLECLSNEDCAYSGVGDLCYLPPGGLPRCTWSCQLSTCDAPYNRIPCVDMGETYDNIGLCYSNMSYSCDTPGELCGTGDGSQYCAPYVPGDNRCLTVCNAVPTSCADKSACYGVTDAYGTIVAGGCSGERICRLDRDCQQKGLGDVCVLRDMKVPECHKTCEIATCSPTVGCVDVGQGKGVCVIDGAPACETPNTVCNGSNWCTATPNGNYCYEQCQAVTSTCTESGEYCIPYIYAGGDLYGLVIGGVCAVPSANTPNTEECASNADCVSKQLGDVCLESSEGVMTCYFKCDINFCDTDVPCYEVQSAGTGICVISDPLACSVAGQTCESGNGSGLCGDLYGDGSLGCYPTCNPATNTCGSKACTPTLDSDGETIIGVCL